MKKYGVVFESSLTLPFGGDVRNWSGKDLPLCQQYEGSCEFTLATKDFGFREAEEKKTAFFVCLLWHKQKLVTLKSPIQKQQ